MTTQAAQDTSRLPTGGTIRKLTVGGSKEDGITYVVGKAYREGTTLTRIVRDENSHFNFGAIAYFIYVGNDDGDRLWKIIERQPVTVEYDLGE